MVSQAWEHLQSVVNQVHNRRVREEFSDLADDDDISTPRASLRTACMMRDSDSAEMTLIRYMLFYFDLRKAKDMQAEVYGAPVTTFQELRRFKPQIQLYFQEDYNDVEPTYSPVTAEISFRLMTESNSSISEAELRQYASKIRSEFANAGGYVWRKGKIMCSYTDHSKGYQLQLLSRSKTDAKSLITKILDIQNDTPDWKRFNTKENEEPTSSYPTVPPRENILGKSRRMPRSRPIAAVRFQYAAAHIYGLPKPVVLVDRGGIFAQSLLRA